MKTAIFFRSGSALTTLITCPGCTHKLALPDGVVGARVKCPRCEAHFEAHPEVTLAVDTDSPKPAAAAWPNGAYSANSAASQASARTIYCIECGAKFALPGKYCPGCGLSLDTMMHGPAARPRWRDLPPLLEGLPVISAILVPVGVLFLIAVPIIHDLFRIRGPDMELLLALACMIGLGSEVMALVCGTVWFYQAWRLMTREDEEFSPGLKTGLLFVPGFNLYWMFVVIPGLSAAIQNELREIAPNRTHNTGWVPGLVGCVLLVIPYLQPIALCMLFGWMLLANNSLRRLIRYHERLRDEEDDGAEAARRTFDAN